MFLNGVHAAVNPFADGCRFADLMDLSRDRSRLDFFLRKAQTGPPAACSLLAASLQETQKAEECLVRRQAGVLEGVADKNPASASAAAVRVCSSPAELLQPEDQHRAVTCQQGSSCSGAASELDMAEEEFCACEEAGTCQAELQWLSGALERQGPPDEEERIEEATRLDCRAEHGSEGVEDDSDDEEAAISEVSLDMDQFADDGCIMRIEAAGICDGTTSSGQAAEQQQAFVSQGRLQTTTDIRDEARVKACAPAVEGWQSHCTAALELSIKPAEGSWLQISSEREELIQLGLDSPPQVMLRRTWKDTYSGKAAAQAARDEPMCRSEAAEPCVSNDRAVSLNSCLMRGSCCEATQKLTTQRPSASVQHPDVKLQPACRSPRAADSWSSDSSGSIAAEACSGAQSALPAAVSGGRVCDNEERAQLCANSKTCLDLIGQHKSVLGCLQAEEVRWDSRQEQAQTKTALLQRGSAANERQPTSAAAHEAVELAAIDVAEQERIMRAIQLAKAGRWQQPLAEVQRSAADAGIGRKRARGAVPLEALAASLQGDVGRKAKQMSISAFMKRRTAKH